MENQVVVSPAVKFLFFSLLKSKKQYKEMKKAYGKIQTVTIIISPAKMFLRVQPVVGEPMDKPYTEEELNRFLKALNINPEGVKESKHVFIQLNMETREVKYQQEKKDGEKINFEL